MDVIREGTQLFNAAQTYRYEVAAACSGLRSLIAIFAISTIYAFLTFDKNWKRILMILLALPLARHRQRAPHDVHHHRGGSVWPVRRQLRS